MARPGPDTNGIIGALLRDLAAVQKETQSSWGYKRAAAAILGLEEPIEALVQPDGSLRKIPNVGPKSARIALEVVRTGGSPTVERAVADSDKAAEIEAKRGLRGHFLSRAQVVSVLDDDTLEGPRLDDYRGDFQMHSVWSDGSQTLDDIVSGCLERGYEFCAVTDHSHGLKVARGMTLPQMQEQHREIDRLNARNGGRFRLLKGVEANIQPDGSIDLTRDELSLLDLVVAAPHAALRSAEDQTARMKAAVATPGVHVLGHPRGRMYGTRAGVIADWHAVFAAAAAAGVAIEIDGDPSRQDVDHTLAAHALRAGCLFALDSDAHSTPELQYAETAIAHARLAGVPPERVINCWSLGRLIEWLTSRG
jgi:histidinol phosphatase-like PHP family hydrolase